MNRDPFYYCNGSIVRASRASLNVRDLGVIRGFGLFESLRTYGGKPFLLGKHLDRLFRAARLIQLPLPLNRKRFETLTFRLLRKNAFPDALIRIIVTGGPAPSLVPQGKTSVVILVDPFHPFPPGQYQKGIALMTAPFSRIRPEVKSTIYFGAVLSHRKALARGCQEAVYVDSKGSILEGTTYSVCAVLPGPRLIIPEESVLPGITAECVIRIARQQHIPVERRPITRAMGRQALEMFITSSNRELIPVVKVDRQRIGNGKPGPVTQELHAEYREMVRKHG